MALLKIVDANNHIRRLIEADASGMPMRTLLAEIKADPSTVWIFVWDGQNGNKRRRDLFPDYKKNRNKPDSQIWVTMDLFREALSCVPVFQARVPEYEGDDVIATLVDHYRAAADVKILSTDKDLLALGVPVLGTVPSKVPSGHIRLYKTLVGDPSDSIPGAKGFGQTAWDKVSKSAIQDWIVGGEPLPADAQERFSLTQATAHWIAQNTELLRTFWTIVGFFRPELPLVQKHMTQGVNNPDKINDIFKRLML